MKSATKCARFSLNQSRHHRFITGFPQAYGTPRRGRKASRGTAGTPCRHGGISLSTGLRRANVTGLQWSQVDLTRRVAWIHPDQAKARKAIPLPLNAEAVLIIRKQLGKNATYVFSYNGNKITQVNTKAWHKALDRVGIENFRWHDLRHTWASWREHRFLPYRN